MKKSIVNLLRIIGFSLVLFPLVSTASCGCSDGSRYRRTPNYILNGTKTRTSGEFDYYQITEGQYTGKYAISLSDAERNNPKTSYTTPNDSSVIGIYRSGFMNTGSLLSITITDNIKVIDAEAFLGCERLGYPDQTIIIPSSVVELGEAAFYGCKEIRHLKFLEEGSGSEGVSACECYEPGQAEDEDEEEGEEQNVPQNIRRDPEPEPEPEPDPVLTVIPAFCFFNCRKMADIKLPSTITEFGTESFNGCRTLQSTIAFQYIRAFRARAFQGCTSLRVVYIPEQFFTGGIMEDHVFNYCATGENGLKFYFAGANVSTWVQAHANWGWYSDYGDPSTHSYTYKKEDSTVFEDDWIYTVSNNEVTISKYNGPLRKVIGHDENESPEYGDINYLTIPDTLGGNKVRYISDTALDDVKDLLERLYLPRTLKVITKSMFDSRYPNLSVIDDNTKCSFDAKLEHDGGEIRKRIVLNGLTELDIIDDLAFVNLPQLKEITQLYLPYSLRAVGNKAFGSSKLFNKAAYIDYYTPIVYMRKVTDFKWDYDEANSKLEIIGEDAFFKLGSNDGDNFTVVPDSKTKVHPSINSDGSVKYTPTVLVFPKSFRHTGISSSESTAYVNEYKSKGVTIKLKPFDDGNKYNLKGEHVFAGCPLISKVIIKGTSQDDLANNAIEIDSNVTDLILGTQTFAYNESLRTIVIEERKGHNIYFIDQKGKYAQPCIGWNAGKNKSDFSGDPALQLLILPNKHTKLRIQNISFLANPRAAMYISGDKWKSDAEDHNIQGCDSATVDAVFKNQNLKSNLSTIKDWKLIANENFIGSYATSDRAYPGFCFNSNVNAENKNVANTYNLSQEMPLYDNIHYHEQVDLDGDGNSDVEVEVGKGSANELITNETVESVNFKGAFVCYGSTGKATLSKYLYDRLTKEESAFNGTATVPHEIALSDGAGGVNKYPVTKVGESAFSAAFCDNDQFKIDNAATYKDLSKVVLPDSITEIGNYAFLRAYGVKEITSYAINSDGTKGADNAAYVMPKDLDYIGKNAFSFCNVVQFLNIPDDCVFYENKSVAGASQTDTSVFSNNFSLRKITFAPRQIEDPNNPGTMIDDTNDNDVYSSTNYTTTIYEHDTGDFYTSALYSTSGAGIERNDDRLLLVLYRNGNVGAGDTIKPSYTNEAKTINGETTQIDKSENPQTHTYRGQFDGAYKSNACLYGAFKMGYWIDTLKIGKLTLTDDSDATSTPVKQPLFSGIYNRGSNKDSYIYLNTAIYNYENTTCNLTTASIDASVGINIPEYIFSGCENLGFMTLPYASGATFPAGVFSNIPNQVRFYVPNSQHVVEEKESYLCAANTIDLTNTGYAGIGESAFKGTSFTTLIAPDINGNFEIGANAFDGSSIQVVNLSNVHGEITIDSSAFANCQNLKTINCSNATRVTINSSAFNKAKFKSGGSGFVWPSSAPVSFGANAFESAQFETPFTMNLPNGLTTIGNNCFKGCTSLKIVSASANLTSFTSIGNYAFSGCTGLTNVAFDKFTALTSIGEGAFSCNAVLAPNGIVNLTSTSLSTIGKEAFKGSKITEVHFDSSALTIGVNAFQNCTSLQKVFFNNRQCKLKFTSPYGQFDGCTSLSELWIPYYNGADSNIFKPDKILTASVMNGASSSARVYLHYEFGTTVEAKWRETSSGTPAKPTYHITGASNITKIENGEYVFKDGADSSDNEYWVYANSSSTRNNVIVLGRAVSVAPNTGIVTFSSGYQMTQTGDLIVPFTSISVTTQPTKTTYEIGESLDLTGMVVKGDGTTDITNYVTVTGFDSSAAGTVTITVTCGDKSTTFTVTIVAP